MNMLNRCLAVAALAALGLAPLAANAAQPPAPPAKLSSISSGSLLVDEYGTRGKPAMIFIPGLSCGPWVWYGEIARYAPNYHIYALTLPGFDGTPALAKGPYFDHVTSDFWKLLANSHIVSPVIVGHSLGGTLAIDLAEQHPELLRGIVAVDGMPIFPGLDKLDTATRQTLAQRIVSGMASATPEQFETTEKSQVLPGMISSKDDVDAAAALTAHSNPAAVAQWMNEDLMGDLRPNLAKITMPLLEIAPFDASVDSAQGITSADAKQGVYTAQLAGAPHATVTMIQPSRHFVMYDQPAKLDAAIDGFLSSLPAPNAQ